MVTEGDETLGCEHTLDYTEMYYTTVYLKHGIKQCHPNKFNF